MAYSISIDRLESYLKSVFKKDVKVVNFELLGSGWHAETWRVVVDVPGEGQKRLVLKFLKGEKGFGHDYPADRAQVLLMAHKDFNKLPRHIKSIDVGYIDMYGDMHSVGDYEEFFILMEEAEGRPYIEDMREILKRGSLTDLDRKKLEKVQRNRVAPVASLDKEVSGSDNRRYVDLLADEKTKNPFENTMISTWVRDMESVLDVLTPMERSIIRWRFGLDSKGEEMTLKEIGDHYSLSRERIRQLQEQALKKLRRKLSLDAA